jgi:GDP-4-dehydro-6-deoxy-D-mannose reductase
MRLLLTGASGFIAKHFLQYINTLQQSIQVYAIYNNNQPSILPYTNLDLHYLHCNMLDYNALAFIIQSYKPTHILHLAAQSSVGLSHTQPLETFVHNTQISANLLEAIRVYSPSTKIVALSSAEVYATSNTALTELAPTIAANAYSLSKLTQEQLMQVYSSNYQLQLVSVRPFNQIGPYQNINFAIPSFAKQVVEQLKNKASIINLQVGNIQAIRDFTDVRDMVQAYWLLLSKATNYQVYNVCSGTGISLADVINQLSIIINTPINTIIDSSKLRQNDNPIMIGDASRIKNELGWQASTPIANTLKEILQSLS